MNTAIGWGLTIILVNYAIYTMTGYPLVWCWMTKAAQPLAYYAVLANLAMAAGIVMGGIWSGPLMAIKVAVLLVVFNAVPQVLGAVMGFGYRCG